jgi:hypothetical protein
LWGDTYFAQRVMSGPLAGFQSSALPLFAVDAARMLARRDE